MVGEMKFTFYPTINHFSVDGEKLFMQFLLVAFFLFFIYIVCRSMRIVEENHIKTTKNIIQLKYKLDVVLARNTPVCESVLYRHVVRCRQSLLAGYLKDLVNEKQYEPQSSSFFQDMPKSSPIKPTFNCTTDLAETVDQITKYKFPGKENFTERNISDGLNISKEKVITQENVCRQENNKKYGKIKDFKIVNHPLESKTIKTFEGQTRKRISRSNIVEKKRTKIPKWNMAQELKNVHDIRHENMKICSVLNNTKSLFKVSSLKKPLLKNQHDLCHDNLKVYTALVNCRSPFKAVSFEKPPSQKIDLANWDINNGDAKICNKQSNSRDTNVITESHETNVENANVAETLMVNSAEDGSVCSSGFDSDCESEPYSEQCPYVPKNNTNNRKKSVLTTINEESAEETNSAD